MKNYYEILGVSKTATDKEIKKAFRNLANKYHPDKTNGDTSTEKKFKEINEAYEVLKDPKKKQQYDQFGSNYKQYQQAGFDFQGFNPQHGAGSSGFNFDFQGQQVDLEDILGGMFGSGFPGGGGASGFNTGQNPYGNSGHSQQAGQDLQTEIIVGFDEAIQGSQREINVNNQTIKVKIPAWAKNGAKLVAKGKGHASHYGGPKGNLIIIIKIAPHPGFRREGNDIYIEKTVPYSTLLLGGNLEITTVYQQKLTVKVKPLFKPGQNLKLTGKGVKSVKSGTGDMLVKINLAMPEKLTKKQTELVKKLQAEGL